MKKLLATVTVFALLISFASCGKNNSGLHEETVSTSAIEEITDTATESPEEITTDEPVDVSEITSEPVSTTTDDPTLWTDEEIIDFYKKAAEKSSKTVKSKQVMVLDKLIINNGEGALGFFTKILEPAIRSVVKKNALEFDGITGGFRNLSVNDTKSVKAYKSGEYTVVEMVMKKQTDDIHANEHEGSVGHAISVLGDISKVLAEFPQFNVDLSNAKIDIHYVNATVKVKINKNGVIEKGTWKYTCDPDISNVKISGINVHTAEAEIDYIITVGDGF